MPKYSFYTELREDMARNLRKLSGLSKKKLKKLKADPVSTVMRRFFHDPHSYRTLSAAVLTDEEDYIAQGRRVFVPEDKALVEMLWRSRMDVDPADLDGFPRCFSVAWPTGTVIEGVELPGCLVWFGNQSERVEVGKMLDKWTPFPLGEVKKEGWTEGRGFHLSFPQGDNYVTRQYLRLSHSPDWVAKCLKSETNMDELGDSELNCVELTSEDHHIQYVVMRCVIHLMVYAKACPEAVISGWPEGLGRGPATKGRRPTTLASPKHSPKGGEHASPEAHLRSGCDAYFRSYPRRKDGTKKAGIYLVRGHGPVMVNAEVDPITVKKVKP